MADQFNGRMLMLARQMRKLSQPELIKAINGRIAQGTLSKIEHGRFQPDSDLVDVFSSALRVRRSFFYDSSYLREPMVSYSRRRQKLAVPDLNSIFGLAEVYRLNLRKCFDAIEIDTNLPTVPAIDPDEFGRNIGDVAAAVRQRWNLPRGPVRSLTKVAEDAGIVIIKYDFGTSLLDGFAQHGSDGLPPLIFLNAAQPRDRWRFSLAHEIGHLAMHRTPSPEQELEANQFASALLMPPHEIIYDFDQPSIQRFLELKAFWGTSVQSLMYCAWQIGKITDRQFRYFMSEISKRGWRKVEPAEPTHFEEHPSMLKWIIDAHLNELRYSHEDLCDLFGLDERDFREMYPVGSPKPKLRLVASN